MRGSKGMQDVAPTGRSASARTTGSDTSEPRRMQCRTIAYIAIGSNIEPRVNVERCLRLLARLPQSHPIATSAWYRTRPWGIEAQPEFINLVVGLETPLSAGQLLRATQAIEQRLARVRGQRYGPRTIDLDILLFADAVLQGPDLTLPHPALLERDFMLVPLLEIAPDLRHPVAGLPLRDLTERIRYRQIIERLADGARTGGDDAL